MSPLQQNEHSEQHISQLQTIKHTIPTTPPLGITDSIRPESHSSELETSFKNSWHAWLYASKQIIHVYVVTHIIFGLLTYFAVLFSLDNFSAKALSLSTLYKSWGRWDTGHFVYIAEKGYTEPWRTAFFPLYPLLQGMGRFVTQNTLISGLIISNIVTFFLLVVIYRLVKEDFGHDTAKLTALFMAIFPTAFFLVAAYNESLFLLLTLAGFYNIRKGNWWMAGLLGFLASLTRSSGVLLVFPFIYEYARHNNFNIRKMLHFNILSIGLIPAGVAAFAAYCYFQFGNALAFSQAQKAWGRSFEFPLQTFRYAIHILRNSPILTFSSIHTVIDLGLGLLILGLIVLCCVGPWRIEKSKFSYIVYAVVFYLFLISFPSINSPVQSLSRQVIEVFPAFIILASMGKNENFKLYYMAISLVFLAFMLLQFLSGGWIV